MKLYDLIDAYNIWSIEWSIIRITALQKMIILFLLFSRINSWKEQRRGNRVNTASRRILPSQPNTRPNYYRNVSQPNNPLSRQHSHSSLVKSYSTPSPNSGRSSVSGSGDREGRYIRPRQGIFMKDQNNMIR